MWVWYGSPNTTWDVGLEVETCHAVLKELYRHIFRGSFELKPPLDKIDGGWPLKEVNLSAIQKTYSWDKLI
jgi:hypothetical protein